MLNGWSKNLESAVIRWARVVVYGSQRIDFEEAESELRYHLATRKAGRPEAYYHVCLRRYAIRMIARDRLAPEFDFQDVTDIDILDEPFLEDLYLQWDEIQRTKRAIPFLEWEVLECVAHSGSLREAYHEWEQPLSYRTFVRRYHSAVSKARELLGA